MDILETIAMERAAFIDGRQDRLSSLGRKLQDMILEALMKRVADEFETSKGRFVLNGKNITATAAIQKILSDFMKNEQMSFVKAFVNDIQNITTMNGSYFGHLSENSKIFTATRDEVTKIMAYRLGITSSGELVPRGFLDSFIRDTTLINKVRDSVLSAVTKQLPMRDLMNDLRLNVIGAQGADGPIVSKYQSYIFDVYQQHDRATSSTFAQSLGLEAFIYAGGLIDTSREFCQARNGKIFTVTEAQDWVNDPTLPRTTEERKAGRILNYNPVIDCGRWRCRHHVNYILKTAALKIRPDLKFAA